MSDTIWTKLAAPLPTTAIQWRQDGRPAQRDGKWFARFVAYVDAQFVRERLDEVAPGEWDLSLDLLPPPVTFDGEQTDDRVAFKARLKVLGVEREDVGMGKDYKAAASDAFKRAAVRFGVAHELYAYEQNWVQVDSDSKYAKPVEDPNAAYARRYGTQATRIPQSDVSKAAVEGEHRRPPQSAAASARPAAASSPAPAAGATSGQHATANATAPAAGSGDEPSCPKCGGRMWDNRASKKNPKAPEYKCRTRTCEGVIWPDKGEKAMTQRQVEEALDMEPVPGDEFPHALRDEPDGLPF